MKKEELIVVCQRMGLSIEGTVPELRVRVRDAGGLQAVPAQPQKKALMAPVPVQNGSTHGISRAEQDKKRKAGASSSAKPKKPKVSRVSKTLGDERLIPTILPQVPTLPAPELTEEPMMPVDVKGKGPKIPEKPSHNHPITEEGTNCQVCDTYGNPLAVNPLAGRNPIEKPKSVDEEGLRSRLEKLLASQAEGQVEDCDEDEEEEPDEEDGLEEEE